RGRSAGRGTRSGPIFIPVQLSAGSMSGNRMSPMTLPLSFGPPKVPREQEKVTLVTVNACGVHVVLCPLSQRKALPRQVSVREHGEPGKMSTGNRKEKERKTIMAVKKLTTEETRLQAYQSIY